MAQWIHPERFQATITSADAQSATQVKAKTAGKKMYIRTLIVSVGTAMEVSLQDDTGTPVIVMEELFLGTNGGAVVEFSDLAPLVVDTNKDLDVITSAAGDVSVSIFGYLSA